MRQTKGLTRVLIIFLLLISASASWAAEGAPVKVAILPLSLHAPGNMAYLQDGIRDMLTSRLSSQGKLQVIDRATTDQAAQGNKSDISLADAQRIGKGLRADYVIFGSVTALGQSVSIDAKMTPISGSGEPLSLYAQTKSLDDLMPRINQFAQEINAKVF